MNFKPINFAVCVTIFMIVASYFAENAVGQNLKLENPVETQTRTIAQELRCPVCQGQSVYDSNAPLARQMRQTIREKLEQGNSPAEIVSFFTTRYGNYVLMAPPRQGMHWGIWLAPFFLVAAGTVYLVIRIHRQKRSRLIQQSTANAVVETNLDIERIEL